MKDVPEFVLVVCLAVLALGVVKLLNEVNKRLLPEVRSGADGFNPGDRVAFL
jgi:hypothetical protein